MKTRLRLPAVKLSLALALGAAGILFGVIAVVRALPGPMSAVTAPFARHADDDPLAKYLLAHDELTERSRMRFEGRSMFFAPPVPRAPVQPRPPVTAPPRDPEPPPPPAILPAPATYGGPKPRSLIGNIVIFAEGTTDTKITLGEKVGDVELLGIGGPFSIKVAWTKAGHERGEYVISTWEDRTRNFDGLAPNPFPKSAAGFQPAGTPAAENADDGGTASGRSAFATGGAARRRALPTGESEAVARPAAPSPPPHNVEEEPDAPAEAGVESVPLEELPAPLTEEAIAGMSKQAAQESLTEIVQALALPNVDSHNRARLEHEVTLLTQRIRADQ